MFVLNQEESVANQFLAELRDTRVQQDRLRFRTNLKRLGSLLAYEISKSLEFKTEKFTTPLAETSISVIKDEIVLIPIMRAALPFYEGFLEMFDKADAGFIGAWRVESDVEIEAELNYQAAPDLSDKTVIVIDPMLATGKSLIKTVKSLLKNGNPKSLHLASVIAAPEGIKQIKESLESPFHLWTCALDECLNDKSYIVPGLGDAGDLAFGSKL